MGLWAIGTSLEGLALVSAAAGALISAIWTTGEALQRWPDSPLEIELRDDGTGAWLDRRGARHETRVSPGGYVSLWLVVVLLTGVNGRRKWVVIPQDAASGEDRRRLRVWLRWRSGKIDPRDE